MRVLPIAAGLWRSLFGLFAILIMLLYIPIASATLQPFSCAEGVDGVLRMTAVGAGDYVCDNVQDCMLEMGYRSVAMGCYMWGVVCSIAIACGHTPLLPSHRPTRSTCGCF